MWKLGFALSVVGVMTGVASQTAVGRPDFSGDWIEESRPTPPQGQVGVCPKACVITHTADALVVKSALGTMSIDLRKTAFTVDRSNPRVSVERTVSAEWQDSTLVVTSTFKETTAAAAQITTVLRLALREGRLLISGTNPKLGGGDAKFEVVYKRKS